MMDALKAFQAPNGLWRQLIDDPEAWMVLVAKLDENGEMEEVCGWYQ